MPIGSLTSDRKVAIEAARSSWPALLETWLGTRALIRGKSSKKRAFSFPSSDDPYIPHALLLMAGPEGHLSW